MEGASMEAALSVVNTMSMEEAMNIFTKGLKPVVSGMKQNGDTMMIDQYDYSEDQLGGGQRDVVSAPF
ncbi:hypothetical protein FEM48_Zijuj08G0188500 [Ziziphus jujuba var. spinosa]|uniref:Uncharacterized protein n=1 Tax=Ziziphus jujuba var. spinosa TaxID=714518 RepID=A0A978V0S3_ZIZJJ|nr:hypothetical protein FEM48_Zijuj08G0188500 [Ziziphus jujuba var. spinosa]